MRERFAQEGKAATEIAISSSAAMRPYNLLVCKQDAQIFPAGSACEATGGGLTMAIPRLRSAAANR